MAGNGYSLVRPKEFQQDPLYIAAGSPLAIQGVFIEILRERFRADTGLPLQWKSDIEETDIVIEAGFNEETESRSQIPGIYVQRLENIPAKVVVGDRVGARLPDHLEGFAALSTVGIGIDCIANDQGASAVLGDITQFMLLASQDVIQREFGFHDMSHPSLSQTTPFEQDQTKWNTQITFQVQFFIRWMQVPIRPLLQQIAQRVTVEGKDASGHFVDVTINSLKRGEVYDPTAEAPGSALPPSRVSIVGPQGPPGPEGPQGPPGPAGAIEPSLHEQLDTFTHAIAEDNYTEMIYSGSDLTDVIIWESVAKLTKIREINLSYTGANVTGITAIQYDETGTPVTTLTKTLSYDGSDNLESVTTVRS